MVGAADRVMAIGCAFVVVSARAVSGGGGVFCMLFVVRRERVERIRRWCRFNPIHFGWLWVNALIRASKGVVCCRSIRCFRVIFLSLLRWWRVVRQYELSGGQHHNRNRLPVLNIQTKQIIKNRGSYHGVNSFWWLTVGWCDVMRYGERTSNTGLNSLMIASCGGVVRR